MKSAKLFNLQSEEEIKVTNNLKIKYGRAETDVVLWHILQEKESVNIAMGPLPKGSILKKSIDESKKLSEIFFELLWPSIKGKSLILDLMTADSRHPWYKTVQDRGIKFHADPAYGLDADMKLKSCIMILILASGEVDEGAKLWSAPSTRMFNGIALKTSHLFADYSQ